MVIRGQERNALLLFPCFFLLVSLCPHTTPRARPRQSLPSPLVRHSRKWHYCSHFTGGDTETRGKATPGLCPGVGPQADPCWSPVLFTPASPQAWRARWSPAALRAKHNGLCAETGKGEAREARGTAGGPPRSSSVPGRVLSVSHLSPYFTRIPQA